MRSEAEARSKEDYTINKEIVMKKLIGGVMMITFWVGFFCLVAWKIGAANAAVTFALGIGVTAFIVVAVYLLASDYK